MFEDIHNTYRRDTNAKMTIRLMIITWGKVIVKTKLLRRLNVVLTLPIPDRRRPGALIAILTLFLRFGRYRRLFATLSPIPRFSNWRVVGLITHMHT